MLTLIEFKSDLNMSFLKNLQKALLMSVASFSGGMAYFLPNTVFLDNVKEIVQLYKRGASVPISNEVMSLSKAVMNDMKFTKEDQDQIQLFTISGFGFFHAGSVWKSNIFGKMEKAILGIPVNFDSENLKNNLKNDIIVYGELINWSSEDGHKLEEALILSEKAKKFALAQQLFYISSYEILFKGAITAFTLNLTLFYLDALRTLMKKKNIKRGWPVYVLLCTTKLVLWILLKDGYTCYLENKADQALSDLGKDYVEGGLEFYENVLKTNSVLRSLAEKMGQSLKYTLFGNEETLLRTKHIPITARRDYFKNLLS